MIWHLHKKNLDNMIYRSWDIECDRLKFLHMYPTNKNHMMDPSLDMEQNRQNCFVILDRLLPFYPLTTRKIKIFKKMKKMPGDIIILYTQLYHKWQSYEAWFDNHMKHDSSDMKCNRIFCYSGTFFALLPH